MAGRRCARELRADAGRRRPALPRAARRWRRPSTPRSRPPIGAQALLDARSGERFRGEVEPIDAVAGHIPGALNRFHKANLDPAGAFKSPTELRAEFAAALGDRAPGEVIHSCGSGVTACHNLLAMEHAGLNGSLLYPGSWSEWSADPDRPIARG
jgi:thiosulfate/3-mercaptopyruvate sulfurtransferase